MQIARMVTVLAALLAGCGGGGGDDTYTAEAEISLIGALTIELTGEIEVVVSEQGGETYSDITLVDDGTFELFQCGALISGELGDATEYESTSYTNLGGWRCDLQQTDGGPSFDAIPADGITLFILDPPPHLQGTYDATVTERTGGATADLHVSFYDPDTGPL